MKRPVSSARPFVIALALAVAVTGAVIPHDPAAAQMPAQEMELRQLAMQIREASRAGRLEEALDLSRRATRISQAYFGPQHRETLAITWAVGSMLQRLGRYDEAEPILRQVLAVQERVLGPDDVNTMTTVTSLGMLYSDMSRFAEAEPFLLRSVAAAGRVPPRDTIIARGNLGNLYRVQGRLVEARPLLEGAVRDSTRLLGADARETLAFINVYGNLLADTGDYAGAIPVYQGALTARRRAQGADHPETLEVANNLIIAYVRAGRVGEAETLCAQTLGRAEARLGRDHPITTSLAMTLGGIRVTQNRLDQAEPLLRRAYEGRLRRLGPDHRDTQLSAATLAAATLRLPNRRAQALPLARAMASALRTRLRVGETPFAAAQFERERDDAAAAFGLLAEALWQSRPAGGGIPAADLSEAASALQEAISGGAERALTRTIARQAAQQRDPALARLILERETLLATWTANNRRLADAVGGQAPDLQDGRRIEERIAAIDGQLRVRYPAYLNLLRPEPIDLAAVRAMLRPDEAILVVVPGAYGTHLMAVTANEARWERSDWSSERVGQAVTTILNTIRGAMAGRRYTYDRQTAHALYGQLIAPVAATLAGKRMVFVVAAGPLTSLPFGVLVAEPPQGSDTDPAALRTTRWFADLHAIAQIPSIQSLAMLRSAGAPPADARSPASFIGFGDPLLTGTPAVRGRGEIEADASSVFQGSPSGRNVLADPAVIGRLGRLPGTAVELETMRAALGAPAASLHVAARATERAFRTTDFSRTRIIALATHGLVAGELRAPAEPGLIFTPPAVASPSDDGFLTASEVAGLRLNADWVILSACNTASSDGTPNAPGLSGLARAFFAAGARALLVSHWPVADAAAPRLTVRTIELVRGGGISRAEALQRAMREVRDDPAHPEWAHPGVWGPFSLIGDGAR